MPGFDGTGPLGLGPMTGRGMGYCVMPLPQPKRGRIQYGFAGISGMKVPITSPYALGSPYLSGLSSYVPFRRPWFRRGVGRGKGWFRFGRGRICGSWPFGWW
jgi:hypothetical protein